MDILKNYTVTEKKRGIILTTYYYTIKGNPLL